MTCGGFDKRELNMNFDYKSREMEKGTPVCVACINESRTHQIPGEYEHTCGKQPTKNASDTQLPAEVENEITAKAEAIFKNMKEHAESEWDVKYAEGFAEGWADCATEYAIKLHQLKQEFGTVSTMFLDLDTKHEQARALLQKFISRHEAGLLPDQFIYNEIKQFLYGK
jgi:flagellar biosynthesis/type III secretory pathway protein FliH